MLVLKMEILESFVFFYEQLFTFKQMFLYIFHGSGRGYSYSQPKSVILCFGFERMREGKWLFPMLKLTSKPFLFMQDAIILDKYFSKSKSINAYFWKYLYGT